MKEYTIDELRTRHGRRFKATIEEIAKLKGIDPARIRVKKEE